MSGAVKGPGRRLRGLFVVAGLAALPGCRGEPGITLANGGFEQPAIAPAESVRDGIPGWRAEGGPAGVTGVGAGNPLSRGGPEAPAGRQVAFLGDAGALSQRLRNPATRARRVVLSFSAMRGPGDAGGGTPGIRVMLDGQARPFRLGGPAPAGERHLVTPPAGHYQTYALALAIPPGTHTLTLAGAGRGGVLIDNVAISTPAPGGKAYGFFDQGFRRGTWRSDLPAPMGDAAAPDGLAGQLAYGPCLFDGTSLGGTVARIITAGATPHGDRRPDECHGHAPGLDYPRPTASNWYASADHDRRAGSPHWTAGVNVEFVALPGRGNSGPPNQSLPLAAAGRPGPVLVVDEARNILPGTRRGKAVVLGWRASASPTHNLPYLSFAASAAHGNGGPVAVLDSAGRFSPRLRFTAGLLEIGAENFATYVYVITSGWFDGIPRGLLIRNFNAGAPAYADPGLRNAGWNWNVRNSVNYPGAIFAYLDSEAQLGRWCPGLVPGLPRVPYLDPAGGAPDPRALVRYDIDLRALVRCAVEHGAWGGLEPPDPLVVSQVEWSLETLDNVAHTAHRLAIADMRVD